MNAATPQLVDSNPAETCLARVGWQEDIFAAEPQRFHLLRLRPSWYCRAMRLHVHRNQPFEFVETVLTRFLAYAGWTAHVTYSAYDDSLSFITDRSHNVELVWLDFDRYGDQMRPTKVVQWLFDRLVTLRAATGAPILVTDWAGPGPAATKFNRKLRQLITYLPGVYICNQSAIAGALGKRYYDYRAARITGTSMSDAACLHTARQLGLVWLPAVLQDRVKAVVLDLDGTLYDGILGEDGISGLKLTSEHLELQRRLLSVGHQGIYLAVASRNNSNDVQAMFDSRSDLILRTEHFSGMAITWGSKAEGVRMLADQLRIGPESMLLIDDNPGELAAVAAEAPGIKCLHAADVATTVRALELFPGMFTFTRTADDALRVQDLAMVARREQLVKASPNDEYLRSLRIRLGFALAGPANFRRLHELSMKTNQFNTGLRRLSEAEVATYLQDPERRAVSISLQDRLSDSGTVGAVFARREGDVTVIDEIAISCRALGRRLEHLMIAEALRRIMTELPARHIGFSFTPGPRNGPARDWLTTLNGAKPSAGIVVHQFDDQTAADLVASAPIEVAWQPLP